MVILFFKQDTLYYYREDPLQINNINYGAHKKTNVTNSTCLEEIHL